MGHFDLNKPHLPNIKWYLISNPIFLILFAFLL
jgi:hypothetical protein